MIPPPPPSRLDRARPYLRMLVDNVLTKILTAVCPPLLCMFLIAIRTIRKNKESKEGVDEVVEILNGSFDQFMNISLNSTALLDRLFDYTTLLKEIGTSHYVFVIARVGFVLIECTCDFFNARKRTTRKVLRLSSAILTFSLGILFPVLGLYSIDDDYITLTNVLYVVLLVHSIITFGNKQDLLQLVDLILATFVAFLSVDHLTPRIESNLTFVLLSGSLVVSFVHMTLWFLGEDVEDVDELKDDHRDEVDRMLLETNVIRVERDAKTAENDELKQQNETLRREKNELQESIDLKDEEIKQLKRQVKVLGLEKVGMKESIDVADKKNKVLKEQLEQLNKENKELKENVAADDEEKQELKKKLEELGQEGIKMKEVIALKDEDMNRLRLMLEEEEKKAKDLQFRVDEQRNSLDQSQKRVLKLEADAISTNTRLQNLQAVDAERLNEMGRLQDQLQESGALVALLEMERDAAEDQANVLLVERDQLIVGNDEQAAHIVQLQTQMMLASTSAGNQMSSRILTNCHGIKWSH